MSNFQPPRPGPAPGEPAPPPPNRAQQLVAEAGVVVYEGGTSVFNEPVLVFHSLARKSWPDFTISDHLGRTLGRTSHTGGGWFASSRTCIVSDGGGSELFRIQPKTWSVRSTFDVGGVASARMIARRPGLTIESGGEQLGAVDAPRFRGVANDRLTLLDDQRREVGMFRSFKRGGMFSRVDDFVVSLDRRCPAQLRRLAVVLPTVVVMTRRAEEEAAGAGA